MKIIADLKNQLLKQGQLTILLKVTPNAPRTEIFDQRGDGALKIRLQATPEKGKANKALIKFLEQEFKAKVEILKGETNSLKRVHLST